MALSSIVPVLPKSLQTTARRWISLYLALSRTCSIRSCPFHYPSNTRSSFRKTRHANAVARFYICVNEIYARPLIFIYLVRIFIGCSVWHTILNYIYNEVFFFSFGFLLLLFTHRCVPLLIHWPMVSLWKHWRWFFFCCGLLVIIVMGWGVHNIFYLFILDNVLNNYDLCAVLIRRWTGMGIGVDLC